MEPATTRVIFLDAKMALNNLNKLEGGDCNETVRVKLSESIATFILKYQY